ncbi:MAG: ABC transporter permease [Bifidobacteriaceae bacterium]|nr:ABC transporter permease [Bifidobacteriaceae bacterium]
MNTTSIRAQFHLQTLGFLRNSRSVFFTLAFPIVLAVLFGLADKGTDLFTDDKGTVSLSSWIAVGLSSYVMLMGGFVKVAGDIVAQRESGLLKRIRLRGTSDLSVLIGYMLSGLLVSIVCLILLLVVSVFVLHLPAPANPLGVVLVALGGVILSTVIGVAYSSFVPSADAAQMMLLVPTLILMFLSGVFEPSWVLPGALRNIGLVFPVQFLADAMRSMWLGRDFVHSQVVDNGLQLGDHTGLGMLVGSGLYICIAWLVVAAIIAIKAFRWDTRTRG